MTQEKFQHPKEYPEGASTPWIQKIGEYDHNLRMDSKERPPITPELRDRYDRQLTELAHLMNESGLWWQLDGTMVVSLLEKQKGGDYIGEHRDLDMSVRHEDKEKLEEFLRSRGYGLFLKTRSGDERFGRRVSAKVFSLKEGGSPHIIKIDEGGVIQKEMEKLWKIETAGIRFDEEGFPLGYGGVRLPKEWLEGRTLMLNGEKVQFSNPARYLYWKIGGLYGYNDQDIERLGKTGAITLKDVEDVAHIQLELQNPDKERRERIERRLAILRQIIQEKSQTDNEANS